MTGTSLAKFSFNASCHERWWIAVIAAVSIAGTGCSREFMQPQQSAPIESRTSTQAQAPQNPPARSVERQDTALIENNDVITIEPLGDQDVGAPIPLEEEANQSADEKSPPTSIGNSSRPNAATSKLLDDAQDALVRGDLATAESVTNRGLRIAPQDPALWLQLAKIRLGQAAYLEAISLSERAQVLAADNVAARIDALQIIAIARDARGENALAEQARNKAKQIRGQLGTH